MRSTTLKSELDYTEMPRTYLTYDFHDNHGEAQKRHKLALVDHPDELRRDEKVFIELFAEAVQEFTHEKNFGKAALV